MRKIADFFLDKDNSGDEKRLFGIVFLIAAICYAFLKESPDNLTLVTLVSTGTGLLGLAVIGDGVKGGKDGGQ